MAGKEKELDKLKKKASMLGLDADALVVELAEEVGKKISAPAVDIELLAIKVEGKLATKLTESVASVQEKLSAQIASMSAGPGVDVEKAINDLKVSLVAQTQKMVQDLFTANKEQFMSALEQAMEAKMQQGHQPAGGLAGGSFGDILGQFLAHGQEIASLIQAFKGAPSPDQQIASQLGTIFRWHNVLTKIESGKANATDLQQAITETVNPAPAPTPKLGT